MVPIPLDAGRCGGVRSSAVGRMRTVPILAAGLLAALPAATLLAACGAATPGEADTGTLQAVAGENMWGSILAQLGGAHLRVTSIVSNPDTDPHAYEATPDDARAVAQARYVVVNGAGYDTWLPKLVDANPDPSRITLDVAALTGRSKGDNPHLWYSPAAVLRVVQRMSADLQRLDPRDAAYFARRAQEFTSTALRRYDALRSSIRARYAQTPVAATESVFADMAADLGLDLRTPPAFMRAISEGDEPTTGDRTTVEHQLARRQVAVLVYNRQNSTPDVQGLLDLARAQRIPVVAVTETLAPASATFEDWQSNQLAALQQALATATGR